MLASDQVLLCLGQLDGFGDEGAGKERKAVGRRPAPEGRSRPACLSTGASVSVYQMDPWRVVTQAVRGPPSVAPSVRQLPALPQFPTH